ncbi:MAG: acetyl-CoA hydrolase/transferase family protein [Firmicutes bacterium]|nr:acetyl-CoA hydrolase/transferase family protein [Bacillota bacterium]MBQ3199425.1 acetyl-CoA hydrolase/transferase family protein [Bacillota bacterium]
MTYEHRIRCKALLDKVVTAEEAAKLIKDGDTLGCSGFTPSGYPKAVPLALAERVKAGEQIKVNILTGASVGPELDGLADVGAVNARSPYQTNDSMRKALNTKGGVKYNDQHLSLATQYARYGFLGNIDLAIVEACAITEEGHIVPTTSVGSAPTFVKCADKVIVEINTSQPEALEGMHDIYVPLDPPYRKEIPIYATGDRVGTTYIECGPEKIAAIVVTDITDKVRPLPAVTETEQAIADNIVAFFNKEVEAGRLPKNLLPLQSGVGGVANAVLASFAGSDLEDLTFYSEVIQDGALDLIDCGKFVAVSGTSLTPSVDGLARFKADVERYKKTIVLRPQEISNNPEVARRLGVISMNTAIEVDIYGHVNSTHIMGTRMMNGIGGSGDFTRAAYISIFMTGSVAKGGDISSIVPMCSHIDHTEHDVNVIVTEQGVADLRNLCPRERALAIINNCAHPDYKPMLLDYYNRALEACPDGKAHTPHIMEEALSWHVRFNKTGSMKMAD